MTLKTMKVVICHDRTGPLMHTATLSDTSRESHPPELEQDGPEQAALSKRILGQHSTK